jgi:hypothetical protein
VKSPAFSPWWPARAESSREERERESQRETEKEGATNIFWEEFGEALELQLVVLSSFFDSGDDKARDSVNRGWWVIGSLIDFMTTPLLRALQWQSVGDEEWRWSRIQTEFSFATTESAPVDRSMSERGWGKRANQRSESPQGDRTGGCLPREARSSEQRWGKEWGDKEFSHLVVQILVLLWLECPLVDLMEVSVVDFDDVVETDPFSDPLLESSISWLNHLEHEVVGHAVDEMSHLPSFQSTSETARRGTDELSQSHSEVKSSSPVQDRLESAELMMTSCVKESNLCPPGTRESPLNTLELPQEREQEAVLVQCFTMQLGFKFEITGGKEGAGERDHSCKRCINFIIQNKDFPSRVPCEERVRRRGGEERRGTWVRFKELDSQSVENISRLELSVAGSQRPLQQTWRGPGKKEVGWGRRVREETGPVRLWGMSSVALRFSSTPERETER